MEVDKKTIEGLMKLGLTKYEALAYAALVQLGSGTVADIHRVSGVPSTKLYEVLSRLEAKGWVEILKERPMKFRARPPQEVLDATLKDLSKTCEDVKNALIEIYERRLEIERSDVWMVRGFSNVESKMISMIKGARRSVSLALSKLAVGFLDKVRKLLLSVYWRGLSVAVLVSGVEEKPDLGGIEVALFRTPLVGPEITIVHSMVVVDSSELLLVLPIGVGKETLRDVVGVWVRDKSLASLAEEYMLFMIKVARELESGFKIGPQAP